VSPRSEIVGTGEFGSNDQGELEAIKKVLTEYPVLLYKLKYNAVLCPGSPEPRHSNRATGPFQQPAALRMRRVSIDAESKVLIWS
jgi:hypothetical protein